MNPRRTFLMTIGIAGVTAAVGARAQPVVDEKEPQAVALGYVTDASRADAKKFPMYAPGHSSGNCALFQGKVGDATGACALFAGKLVSAKGWCSAWVKKGPAKHVWPPATLASSTCATENTSVELLPHREMLRPARLATWPAL